MSKFYNFVNTEDPEKSEGYTAFNHGCTELGLPYHTLKQQKGYPKKHGPWIVLNKEMHGFKKEKIEKSKFIS